MDRQATLNIDLRHRTILVTGAAQGLGLGIAHRLARTGARLVLADCNPVVMDHPADAIFANSAHAFVHDLSEPGAAQELVRSALGKVGHLDGLVNCAAWSFHKPLSETTVAEFDRVVAVNQRAPYFLSQEFANALGDDSSDPCIVNIASVNAVIGNRELTAYASTKGALVAMGRAMAVELAPRIRVVTISPGAVLTKYTENMIAQGEMDVEHLLSRLLLKRFMNVDEIADLVVFLFGPSARSITGSNWVIDGGLTAQ
jgi:NAD(P)-dependent dehydrogenase (short-subunit alcohol dehydrogenase family)